MAGGWKAWQHHASPVLAPDDRDDEPGGDEEVG